VGIGLGVLVEEPGVLLAGVVGVGFAAYARSSTFASGRVSIERAVAADDPDPDDDVEVAVTVTNESDRFLADLRIVDGVPPALGVATGSPRRGLALRPGESETFSYAVTARRGVHEFEPALLVSRSVSGATEATGYVRAETSITCIPSPRPTSEPVPLRGRGSELVGEMASDTAGNGVEFYATREYQPGDARNRIDWNRRARTGELTTVEFREERAATVMLVVDAREVAYVGPDHDGAHAVDRCVAAAGSMFSTLLAAGHRVGITAIGPGECWLAPGVGADHRLEARTLLGTHPALSPVPPEPGTHLARWRRHFRKRLGAGTQLVFLSPLADGFSAAIARRFDGYGYPVTAVSPDPTVGATPGNQLARIARKLRVSELRNAGIPVVDWAWDEPLDAALARYNDGGFP